MSVVFSRPLLARACACSALGGVAIGFGGAPYEAFAVAWLGPGLVYAALRALSATSIAHPRAASARHALRRAAAVGLAAGLASNATTCAWSVELLTTYAYMPWPLAWLVASLLFLAQSLPFVAGAMLAWAAHELGGPLLVVHPIATVVGASAAPMIFPWRIGNSQTGFLALAQLAELGGLPLLDLLLAAASTLAMAALLHPLALARRVGALALAASLLALPALWGARRLEEVREARLDLPVVAVGVVQHSFDIPERMDSAQWELQLATTFALTRDVEREGVDLVTWPESSFPWWISRRELGRFAHDLDLEAQDVRGPIVLGGTTHDGDELRYNSVLAVDRTHFLGVVDKTRLMPFSERIPAWDLLPFLHPFLRPGLTPGPASGGALDVSGQRLGILNCYEDLMADQVWATMQHDPTFLSNHTNDAWFGRTRAPGLHHFLARMRAIETRRDLLRTVNTGVSGLVAATGETEVRTEIFDRAIFVARVRPSRERTLWVRFGDLTTASGWGALLGLLGAAVVRSRRPRKGARPPDGS